MTVDLCYEYNGDVVDLAELSGNDDPVKKLFGSGYSFRRTLTANSSDDLDWKDLFTDLPLRVNPSGTQVYNGESFVIRYSVAEAPLNGYTTSYAPTYRLDDTDPNAAVYNGTALNGESGAGKLDELTVTNTLKTKTVQVKKQWEDGVYRGDQAKHYDVHLTLAKTADASKTLTDTISCATGSITSATTVTDAVSFTVPQYNADGTPANYTVTEDGTDRQYGYVTTYTANHIFDAAGDNAVADNAEIIVTNTLPLTTVSVTKQWADDSDHYTLRPASIKLHLMRSVDQTTWQDYEANVTAALSDVTDSGNTWTYTYSDLPRYDAQNRVYYYKVAEDQVNAYDTDYLQTDSSYAPGVVTRQDSTAADGADSSLSFGVRNTLITAPITMTKVWNDNGYPDDLHYPVTFRIGNSDAAGLTFSAYDVPMDPADSTTTTAVSTVNGHAAWSVSREVPVYDTNGDPIRYAVTELDDATHPHHYGYDQVTAPTAVRQTLAAPASTAVVSGTAITQAGTHMGYAAGYYDSYTIVNELPLTYVTADKHWNGDVEMYPNADAVVKVNLTCTPKYPGNITLNAEKTIAYAAGTVTFDKLLVKDYSNSVYTYTVTEQTVKGYSTEYVTHYGTAGQTRTQDVTATSAAADHTVTVINTPLKSSAEFVKYDLTDLERHGTESSFSLITLPGAKFELHRVLSGNDKTLCAEETAPGTAGAYTVTDTPTDPLTVITSGSDGRITLSNLEPNVYYLKEIEAPDGYQTQFDNNSDRIFRFTVSVSDQNVIGVTYDSKELTKTASGLELDGSAFSASDAASALTELSAVIPDSTAPVYGIPDEENMSRLTLTKVDSQNQTQPLANATYYLLRLYNYEYKKAGASGSTPQEYLTNALNTLGEDYSGTASMWNYWEKVGEQPYYTTDQSGKITVEGHMFGTYVFYEVVAPVGYERDFTHNPTTALTNTRVIGPVELHSGNAIHETEVCDLTHLEPHKTARVKILKTDENGSPLKGATFELYKVKTAEETDDTLVGTVTTGYDGLNPTAITLDPAHYNWDQQFYFIESTPPKGYSADNEDDGQGGRTKITFTLTPSLADETLHIVRANDSRLKGKVNLTKTSSAATSTVDACDPLPGAVFELYTKSGTRLSLYPHTSDPARYMAAYAADAAADVTAAGFDPNTTVTDLTTGANGKLSVEGLDWGDYYLTEKTAPSGFSLPSGEDARVYFSVGRSTCGDVAQELSMTNDPLTAQLNLIKHIDQYNDDAWGEPTFIFTVRQTERYDHTAHRFVALDADDQTVLTKTITPTTAVTGGFEDETGAFSLEPGKYVVTEVRVARYSAAGVSATAEISSPAGKVNAIANTDYTATLELLPDGEAEVRFDNTLTNYEKLSHADRKTNRFNGLKALRVGDKDELTPTQAAGVLYSVTVPKADLTPVLIRSDGTTEPITDTSKLAVTGMVMSDGTVKPISELTCEEDEITVTDNGASITLVGRMEDLSGSTYTFRAVYDGMFSDDFEMRFAVNPLYDKSEKTVTFLNDAQNKSYYSDNGNRTGVYTLIYILENPDTVRKILHKGTAISAAGTAAFPTIVIDGNFADEVEFDRWSYTYTDGGTTVSGNGSSSDLLTAIIAAPDSAQITVTAVLRAKSAP